MGAHELAVIGLTCNLVGVFFLANSMIFRKLWKVIEEFFQVRSRTLKSIKHYTLNNFQVALGFMFLTVGFLLEIYARLDSLQEQWALTTTLACLAIVVMAAGIYLVGAVYSRRQFKRYLRQFFREHPEAFNKEMVLTKEIGEFLGIPHDQETTAEDYLAKVKRGLGVLDEDRRSSSSVPGQRRRSSRSVLPSR
ncbi:MAG: hypothetical protein ACYTF5_16640 [Planctomycetota bacterium]|jgi:hypothetical protein